MRASRDVTPRHRDPYADQVEDAARRIRAGAAVFPPLTPAAKETTFGALPAPRRHPSLVQTGSAYDATLAVGRAHVLVAGNFDLAIHAKDGALVLPARPLGRWFRSAETLRVFDPRAVYDQYAHRWILAGIARADPASWLFLSVSSDADPLRPWWTWRLDAQVVGDTPAHQGLWADYPCLGVDERAVYVTLNMYRGSTAEIAKLRIFDKAPLYAGARCAWWDAIGLTTPLVEGGTAAAFSLQPCHTWGPSDAQYLAGVFARGTTLGLWRVSGAPGAPSIVPEPVAMADYLGLTLTAPQADEPKPLGIGGSRARCAVQRGGSVWAAFAGTWGERATHRGTSVRWHEVEGGRVRRSGEVGLDGVHFAFPSLAVDGDRNLRLVASRVSRGEHPGLVHGAWGPAGGGTVDGLAPGEGPHRACRGGRPCEDATADNGWGDYNAAALDPADERTVWLYGAAGALRPELWASWLAAVR